MRISTILAGLRSSNGSPERRSFSISRTCRWSPCWTCRRAGSACPRRRKSALDHSAEDGLTTGIAGLETEVIHTPGHTPGSICLLFPKQELLLAGDTLFAGSVGRTDLPGGDSQALLRSIHTRLMPLPESTLVVPGHGEETTLGEERETNPFLQPGVRF